MVNPKLTTLLIVSETLNISKAAKLLNLTQPAVSQHLKSLETEFNAKIFVRGANGMKITPEGEIILKYARRINALYQSLPIAIEDYKHGFKRLNVGVTQTAELSGITELFANYGGAKAGTRIKIISDTINNLYMMLKFYELDLIIVEGKIKDKGFNSILLDTDYLVLAVSNMNPLSKKSMVTLDELKREKLILRLPESGTRTLFEAHLKSNNYALDEFNVILEVDQTAIIKDLVKRNFGVAVLARSVCRKDVRENKFKLIPIQNLSMMREINLVYHKDFDPDTLSDITALYKKMTGENAPD